MSDRTIYRQRDATSEATPYPLGRHVNHDSESRRYVFPTEGLTIVSKRHTRRVPVLDQGKMGSCVPNAGVGCLGTDPLYDTLTAAKLAFDQPLCLAYYRKVTRVDPYRGAWEPDDTGSDGLSMAKVFVTDKLISGYQHVFSLDAALKALSVTPVITGTNWHQDMFRPDSDGRVRPTGSVSGGHEYVADEVDAERERVWFTNSWGAGFGVDGRFYLTFADYGALLAKQGDVTVFVPRSKPPPTPDPDPDPKPADPADATLAKAAKVWLAAKGL